MHRVSFDTNEGSHDIGYWLHLPNSLLDIASIGNNIHDGLHVIIYMPDELEMEAVLKFDKEGGFWKAIPIPDTIKHLDGSR